MVPGAYSLVGSTTHSRTGQFQGRLLILTSLRLNPHSIQSTSMRSTSNGELLRWTCLPAGFWNNCHIFTAGAQLEHKGRLCTSLPMFDNLCAVQGADSASLFSAGGTSLANANLVSWFSIKADGHSYPAPKEAGHYDFILKLQFSIPVHYISGGCLESLRQRFRLEAILVEAMKLNSPPGEKSLEVPSVTGPEQIFCLSKI